MRYITRHVHGEKTPGTCVYRSTINPYSVCHSTRDAYERKPNHASSKSGHISGQEQSKRGQDSALATQRNAFLSRWPPPSETPTAKRPHLPSTSRGHLGFQTHTPKGLTQLSSKTCICHYLHVPEWSFGGIMARSSGHEMEGVYHPDRPFPALCASVVPHLHFIAYRYSILNYTPAIMLLLLLWGHSHSRRDRPQREEQNK